MARRADIHAAFTASIKMAPNGKKTIATTDFVAALAKVNHHWSLREANRWIENYQSFFRDITPHEGEDRLFFLPSMGYVR